MDTPAEKAMAAGITIDLVMFEGFVQSAMIVDNLKKLKIFPSVTMTYFSAPTQSQYANIDCSQLPDVVWDKSCKVVYVRRNPKDCVVSSFCQFTKQIWKENCSEKQIYTGSWNDYIVLYLDGYLPGGPYFDHTIEWANLSEAHEEIEICGLQYEDMKKNCVQEIRKVADYLGRPLSDKTYQDISEACSFKNLKHASEKLKDQTYHFQWQHGSSGYFRKGITGDWKTWFTVAQTKKFDKIYEKRLKETFPY